MERVAIRPAVCSCDDQLVDADRGSDVPCERPPAASDCEFDARLCCWCCAWALGPAQPSGPLARCPLCDLHICCFLPPRRPLPLPRRVPLLSLPPAAALGMLLPACPCRPAFLVAGRCALLGRCRSPVVEAVDPVVRAGSALDPSVSSSLCTRSPVHCGQCCFVLHFAHAHAVSVSERARVARCCGRRLRNMYRFTCKRENSNCHLSV